MIDCGITKGRLKPCKGQGGISEVYIFPYDEDAVLSIDGVTLLNITPTQNIYRFYSTTANLTEQHEEDDGGTFKNQSISLTFPVIKTNTELNKLLKKDYWVIVKDRNDNYRLLGAENGGSFNNLTQQTGGAHADLSGYTIDYSAKEQNTALFTDLTGFDVIGEGDFLLLEDGTFILLENNEEILLEL